MPERIGWVDVYKGLAIIFVVIGHTDSPIGGYIYLFHVAAFFFISGYTTSLAKNTLPRFTLNKLLSLMVPFFSVNLLFILVRKLLHAFPWETCSSKNAFVTAQVKTRSSRSF